MPAPTKATVAKLVKRKIRVPKLDSNKKQMRDNETKAPLFVDKEVACEADDILDFKVDGDTLRVVTTDGQKLTAKAPAGK